MKRMIRHFFLQLKRHNGEHEQSVLRFVFTVLLYLYFLLISKESGQELAGITLLELAYLTFSTSIIFHLIQNPAENRLRIYISAVADISAATCGMVLLDESGAIFYGIYLWVIVGNGLRYGMRALVTSYAGSLIGFAIVIATHGYWSSHPQLTTGLFIPLLLVPLYIIKLRNQLNRALLEAKEANNAKSQFLAHMSHEMRTPLNGLVGIADLLTATPLNPDQRDLVNTLKNSSGILRQLIDNVLDISRIENGKMDTESTDFDLHELTNHTVEMFLPQANAKGLHLHVRFTPDTAFALHGDALHLVQVLINLLGNAIKFTEKGSVELRISTVQQSADEARIRFEIIDTGIGISAKAQHTIFERFSQADASITRKYGGSGLGTTISRDLVRLMGGQIGVQSALGMGSLFWFELPLRQQVSDLRAIAPTALEQLHVIGFSLGPSERTSLAHTLAGWRIRFEHEASLQQLHTRLRNLPPALQRATVVICPALIPGSSAAEFAQGALARANDISLILLGNDVQAGNAGDYLGMGYACVLQSPPDKTLLFNALHGVMAPRPVPGVISFREHYERTVRERRGVHILVADDNGTNRKIIARILEHGGHTVELVENGEQALDRLEQGRYDLMILDKNMPDMGGLEVIKIHRATSLRSTPVPAIILTADATTGAMRECEEAAVEGYLTKPVETLVLLDTIARLTATRRNAETDELAGTEGANPEGTDSTILNEHTLHQLALIGEGQTNFMPLVIHGFIAETEKLLEAMQTALANREYAAFREMAHMVKGSAGNIGAEALYKLCATLMASDRTDAQKLLDEARASFRSTRMLLIQHLGDSSRMSM